jgi:glutamate dehydrogenase
MAQKHIQKAVKSLPKSSTEDVKEFIRTLYTGIPDKDILETDPEILAQIGQKHFDISQTRKPGNAIVTVSSPCKDENNPLLRRTVIEIVQDDMAFLIDSVVSEIVRQNYLISMLIHPTLHAHRKRGKIQSYDLSPSETSEAEAHLHIQLRESLSAEQATKLQEALETVIQDVDHATKDWILMREKLRSSQKNLSHAPRKYSDYLIEEYQAFLEYLYNNNFTLLGYREYKFKEQDGQLTSQIIKGSSLGLLRDEIKPVYINAARKSLSQPQQNLRKNQPPLTIAKVNKRSTVHRPVPLDAIAVKTFDKDGNVTGEILFIGLFTSVTYSRSVSDIPYLRMKVQNVLDRSDFVQNSHDRKALRHILEKYPRDEVLQISEDDLFEHTTSILRLQERPHIALYTRKDPFNRYISCLVYVPRDLYETNLRLNIQSILEKELNGTCASYQVTQDDSPLARVIYWIDINHLVETPKLDVAQIEAKLEDAGRPWAEKLRNALEDEETDEQEIADITRHFGEAFPVGYQTRYTATHAIPDILKIRNALKTNNLDLDLYKPKDCTKNRLRLKIFSPESPIPLSDVLPMIENMGLKVIAELPFEIAPLEAKEKTWIHDFLMEVSTAESDIDIGKTKDIFEEAFVRIWRGLMEDDSLNHLVLTARMNWQEVTVLRAYIHYLKQIRYPFSLQYMETALTSNPDIARSIVKLFFSLHDPHLTENDRKSRVSKYRKAVNDSLEHVVSLDQDRILRGLTATIEATLRTNFFQTDSDGLPKPQLSFKLNSSEVPGIPSPKPYREIFVYSSRVEGIHLRGDVIARGGLRWSDRPEDFRTEVLGLMKAQQVKNAVIVPMGAKGGFVLKKPPTEGGRQAFLDEGIACYKTFIRGLLDITDNRVGEQVVPPQNVVRYDDDDPYLVVAADKGTATFSDIANSLSEEYGFWLGDAFASGGSAGYDHKKMGITARGAWESVKRHFRELNHDTQTQDFNVVGVGDMAGDVFGNGMLLSQHIRLIGAFNHIHIVCDPNPDIAASFKERERLFRAVKGWDEYDTSKLSKGGRIFLRSDKRLELTPEIQHCFDITKDHVTPNELIRAMLKSRTDLLWFGGIGTYIKASAETHADVGDKANDALRINATEIRAKVIGEGANLGVTQAGRIEYAHHGGRLNADYIDNAGGVDSSDQEVNIKILLGDVVRKPKHKMTLEKRNKLLESMTDNIIELVLRHNYQQAQGISLMELQAVSKLSAHAKLMHDLEKDMGLDRELEGLPDDEEIENRLRAGKGLTRPEISVLQSYAKIFYTREFLETDIPDSKAMEERLYRYFPEKLSKPYATEILKHRLKREIISTSLANGMVNRMGPTFVSDWMSKHGASCDEVAKAYIIVREAFGMRELWNSIEALDNKVPATVQLRALQETSRMIERAVTWFLTRMGRKLDINKDIAGFEDGIKTVKENLSQVVSGELAETIEQLTQAGLKDGLPKDLAHDISLMPVLGSACDIIRISMTHKTDIPLTARVYFELGKYFHLDWMRQKARYIPAEDRWSAEALDGLIDQLYTCQAGLTVRILQDMGKDLPSGKAAKIKDSILDKWLEEHGSQARSLAPLFDELHRSASIDLPMLVIVEKRLRNLYGG